MSLSTVLIVLQKIEFKDFSRLLSDFPVPFKEDFIFKGLFKKALYFQVLFKPVRTLANKNNIHVYYDHSAHLKLCIWRKESRLFFVLISLVKNSVKLSLRPNINRICV